MNHYSNWCWDLSIDPDPVTYSKSVTITYKKCGNPGEVVEIPSWFPRDKVKVVATDAAGHKMPFPARIKWRNEDKPEVRGPGKNLPMNQPKGGSSIYGKAGHGCPAKIVLSWGAGKGAHSTHSDVSVWF
jgi:hypothetical protein